MRPKPDFSCGGGGILDPEFIPADVRCELLRHLQRSQLTDSQKDALLNYANDIGQMVMDGEIAPGKSQRKQIETIEANARRLLASLAGMEQPALEALHAHTDYLAYGSAPPVELGTDIKNAIKAPGGSLLSSAWDWVEALEKATQYAAAKYMIDKQSKPEQMRARGYVAMLAEQVKAMTGMPPPKDRSAWFSDFCDCLGHHLDLPIGPRVVASGITAATR